MVNMFSCCGRCTVQSLWVLFTNLSRLPGEVNLLTSYTFLRRLKTSTKIYKLETNNRSSETRTDQFISDTERTKRLHIPVMMKEVIRTLAPQPGQVILDMTFGAGGHTEAILQRAQDILIYALDRDPTAVQIAHYLSEKYHDQIHPLLGRFSELHSLLLSSGVQLGTLDGALIDAGCSSLQLDNHIRGFSLSKDGPLDMRMDKDRYPDMPTAADVVNALDQQALASILRTYGEEKHAKKIASALVQARSIYPITRTQQLASIVSGAFPAAALYARKDMLQRPAHIATKTFQAIRIFVNDELNELVAGLKTAQEFLRPGGRLVVITFHSLEDRIVKRFLHGINMTEKPNLNARQRIREGLRNAEELEDEEDVHQGSVISGWTHIQKKVLTPDPLDVQANPRGRSAKLRAAIKM
ncbi:12S rRNA N4-methylcytidine (m4C) methyltransferase [Protopterus annectens]|uniref:12S rRNA N4-methylcytidine (m4C) methyltransferase n=1 Tax=Protopterus annectens TaxID=7888 RepID=UPI001CFBECBE|nr:12S rRNA N4-methylcytidine (m4C) methyltransferase [Protopterus annectens]